MKSSWNINVLVGKISDSDFVGIVYNHDIVILSETWLAKNSCFNLDIRGYSAFYLFGKNNFILKKNASVEESQYILEHILKKKFI